jgi:hypothetical protein
LNQNFREGRGLRRELRIPKLHCIGSLHPME